MKLPLFAVCRKSQIGFLVKSRANTKGTEHKDKKTVNFSVSFLQGYVCTIRCAMHSISE